MSTLGVCSPVWSPHHSKDVDQLEPVQKFALRMCLKNWEANYHDLLDHYQSPNLNACRQYLSLSHLFKLCKDYMTFLKLPFQDSYSNAYFMRSQEAGNLTQQYARTDMLYHSFFPWTISQWNSLPQSVISCHSLLSFKRNHWSYASQ